MYGISPSRKSRIIVANSSAQHIAVMLCLVCRLHCTSKQVNAVVDMRLSPSTMLLSWPTGKEICKKLGHRCDIRMCNSTVEQSQCVIQITRVPIDPITVGRRWGQRHPQRANSGSIGRINSNQALNMAATSPPYSLASQCMSGQPISICQRC
jgi:hypothetical protein